MTKLEEFEKLFWEQFPIDGDVRFDGYFITELLKEISPRYTKDLSDIFEVR